jgi:integrase
MSQNGELQKKHGSWHVRYYEGGKRKIKKLARVKEYPTEKSIFSVYQQFMAVVNSPTFKPEAGTTLRDFVVNHYFQNTSHLRGSTLRGYKTIWGNHLSPRLGDLRVSDIRVFDVQRALDSIARDNPTMKQATLSRVKSFLHEIFAQAIRLGVRSSDVNPANDAKVMSHVRGKTETFAYSIEDIERILLALPEPSKVLMAIAAYTGLRRGEIVGLKWEDYNGTTIEVRRNICFGLRGEMGVELPKTESSKAPVPVINRLKKILDAWKKKSAAPAGCWIFQAGFTRKRDHDAALLDAVRLTPLSPANVLRDVVIPALEVVKIEWLGYHAFRRGLATNLRDLGVDDLTISEILRHSDVAVTRHSYIKKISEKSVQGLDKLETELGRRDAALLVH